MRAAPGATFTWTPIQAGGQTGLVGTITVGIYHGDTAVSPMATSGINEIAATGIYEADRTAPTDAGRYVLIASIDGTLAPDQLITEALVVSYSAADTAEPSGRDLCTLDDVLALLPGYRESETVEEKLQGLITSESELIHEDSGREIVAAADQPEERDFDCGQSEQMTGEVAIGDLATGEGLTLELRNRAGDTVRTIASGDYDLLYRFGRRQPRTSWEPIVAIRLHRPPTSGYTLHVEGTFGFPQIPPHIREACAKRVLLRYISDVGGTLVTEAAADLNLAAMFASARDAVESLRDAVFIR